MNNETPPPRLVPDRPSDAAIAQAWRAAVALLPSGGTIDRNRFDVNVGVIERRAREIDAAAPPAEAPAERGEVDAADCVAAIDALVCACEREFTSEDVDDLSDADEAVALPSSEITFGHIWRARDAVNHLAIMAAAPAAPAISVEVYSIHDGVGTFNCPDFVKVGDKLYTAPRVTGGRELAVVAKRNLRRLIEIGSNDKKLMLSCLEELS